MAEQDIDASVGPPSRRAKLIPYVIVAGLMLAEGVGIIVAMKTLGSDPAATEAEAPGESIVIDGKSENALPVEHQICNLDAFNKLTGKLLLYHVEVAATIDRQHEERFKKLLELRKSTISDRVTTVIRSADPKYLQEPGLETIRRQIKFELDKVLGDDKIIIDLLIPSLLQSSG